MRYNEPPYSEHYPEIAGVDPHYAAGKGVPPEHNRVERNICWHSPWIGEPWPTGADNGITEKDNLVGIDPKFTDEPLGVLTLGPESPAQGLGCGVIPLDEIGLIRDATRATVPPRVRTALEPRATARGWRADRTALAVAQRRHRPGPKARSW